MSQPAEEAIRHELRWGIGTAQLTKMVRKFEHCAEIKPDLIAAMRLELTRRHERWLLPRVAKDPRADRQNGAPQERSAKP